MRITELRTVKYRDSKPVLRRSDIENILGCSWQWAHKSPQGYTSGAESSSTFLGTKVHAAIASWYTSHIESIPLTTQDVIFGMRASWGSSNTLVSWRGNDSLDLACNLVSSYIDWARRQDWGWLAPKQVETYYEVELETCWLVGTLDMETEAGAIVDLKTTGSYNNGRLLPKESIQHWCYNLMKSGGDVKRAAEIEFYYHLLCKQPAGEIYSLIAPVRESDLRTLVERIIPQCVKVIEAGAYIPNINYKFCDARWCPVWNECRG